MRYLIGAMCVLALGCSSGEPDNPFDPLGTGGSGGSAGSGGAGGTGGVAGHGGTGGGGGIEEIALGLWEGTGDGEDGPFTICFNVTFSPIDGYFFAKPPTPQAVCNSGLAVEFEECQGAYITTGCCNVTDGSFRDFFDQGTFHDISGTFEGDMASGEATTGSLDGGRCTGTWTATPSN